MPANPLPSMLFLSLLYERSISPNVKVLTKSYVVSKLARKAEGRADNITNMATAPLAVMSLLPGLPTSDSRFG